MNKGLKNKGLGSWFCLAAALVALITGIVFLSTQATAAPLGHAGTMPGVVLLVGAAASLVFFFVSVPFSALIQAVIYNIALYLVVVQLYFVFADVINHVTFAGGNAGLCVFYMVGTFVACLLSVIACFCKQTKTGEAKPPENSLLPPVRWSRSLRSAWAVSPCRAAACPRPTMRRLPPMRRRLLPMVPL